MALTDNLVAAWELDEASGDALDSHGSYDLTETSGSIGATSGPSALAGSRDFEAGDSEWFERTDGDLDLGNLDWTLAVWLNMESASGTMRAIQKGHIAGPIAIRYFSIWGQFDILLGGSSFLRANTFGGVSTATWYHVVVWFDAAIGQYGISVNDVADTSATGQSPTGDNSSYAFILGTYFSGSDLWDGQMAQCAYWQRVLTSQERTDLYASGAGLPYSSWAGGGAFDPAAGFPWQLQSQTVSRKTEVVPY